MVPGTLLATCPSRLIPLAMISLWSGTRVALTVSGTVLAVCLPSPVVNFREKKTPIRLDGDQVHYLTATRAFAGPR